MKVPDTAYRRVGDQYEETHFGWDGEIHPRSLVEALVVRASKKSAHYVVTRVIADPYNDLTGPRDDFYNRGSRTSEGPWSSDFPSDPRQLIYIAKKEYSPAIPTDIDSVELDNDDPALRSGDVVQIQEMDIHGREIDSGYPLHRTHAITEPSRNVGSVEEFFKRAANLRPRIAHQLSRSSKKREQLLMAAQKRIEPGVPARPFSDPERSEEVGYGLRSRYTFGSQHVEDHFVDIYACLASRHDKELGGQRIFTESGNQYFTPNIKPFGEASDDDPLCKIEIITHSETVFCPAIGEQRVAVIVDGDTYTAVVNPERSSHYFKEPGHDVIMDGFRRVGVTMDTYGVTSAQQEALMRREQARNKILDAAIERIALEDIPGLEAGAQRNIVELSIQPTEDNRIIAGLADGEPSAITPYGATLLIPKSMLDSVEVIFLGIE